MPPAPTTNTAKKADEIAWQTEFLRVSAFPISGATVVPNSWEPVMSRAEQEGLAYLFRLRMTANVKRALTKMMAERDWTAAGHGWQGKETTLRLIGWRRQRRVVLLRRKLERAACLG